MPIIPLQYLEKQQEDLAKLQQLIVLLQPSNRPAAAWQKILFQKIDLCRNETDLLRLQHFLEDADLAYFVFLRHQRKSPIDDAIFQEIDVILRRLEGALEAYAPGPPCEEALKAPQKIGWSQPLSSLNLAHA